MLQSEQNWIGSDTSYAQKKMSGSHSTLSISNPHQYSSGGIGGPPLTKKPRQASSSNKMQGTQGSSQSITPAITTAGTDQVNSAVYIYLQKRNYGAGYSDTFKRLNVPPSTTQSVHQMALRQVLENESSSNDCIQFSTCGITESRVVELQYSKFKVWISESPDHYKPELAQLLYPMFTHLYLELVTSGKKTDAQKFYKKHQTTFMGNVEFAQFIRLLSPISTPEDLHRDDVVSAYHRSRYSVTLSNKTFQYLRKYLESSHQQSSQVEHPIITRYMHKVFRGKQRSPRPFTQHTYVS